MRRISNLVFQIIVNILLKLKMFSNRALTTLMISMFIPCRYREDGHTKGEAAFQPPNPIRLQWELVQEVIIISQGYLQPWHTCETYSDWLVGQGWQA